VSHNPFNDFESSEWVVPSLQLPSTSLHSSRTSRSQDNWAFELDKTFDHSFPYISDPFFSATETAGLSSSYLQNTSYACISEGALGIQFSAGPSVNPSHIMSLTEPNPYQALSTVIEPGMQQHDLQMDSESFRMSTEPSLPTLAARASPNLQTSSVSSAKGSPASSAEISTQLKRRVTPIDHHIDDRAEKRRRNNIAAAKYRQKKIDRIDELEKQLEAICGERDELKIALAKRDAEVEILRRMLEDKGGSRV
jgi:hypothetical protein